MEKERLQRESKRVTQVEAEKDKPFRGVRSLRLKISDHGTGRGFVMTADISFDRPGVSCACAQETSVHFRGSTIAESKKLRVLGHNTESEMKQVYSFLFDSPGRPKGHK